MIKICNLCKEEKDISLFSKKNKLKDGTQKYQPICKICFNKKDRERIITNSNKENRKEYYKKHYKENKERILLHKKDYHIENRENILEKKREYRKDPVNKQRSKDYIKKYIIENKDKYYSYRKRNPHIISWRNILNRTLRYLGKQKEYTTSIELGYSSIELKEHIEKLFIDGMTWENHGLWEIDHIKPLTKFDINSLPSEVNASSNLQPLWKIDNIKKYNH